MNVFSAISKKPLLKSISGYTFFNSISKAVPILLLPYLTGTILPADYAKIDIFYNFYLFLTPLVGLSVGTSIERYFFDKDEINISVFISNCFYFTILFGLLLIIPTYFIEKRITSWIGEGFINGFLIFVIIYSITDNLITIRLTLYRLENKTKNFGFLNISKSILEVGLVFILIYLLKLGWVGRIGSQVISSLIIVVFISYSLVKKKFLVAKLNFSYFKQALLFGLPLIIHTLSAVIIGFSNRFFIAKYIGLEAVGFFSVAYLIGMIMNMINTSFNQAWTPYLYGKLKIDDSENSITRILQMTYLYWTVLIILSLLLMLIVPIIFRFFIDPKYLKGEYVTYFIILGFLFNGMYKMFVNFFFYYKKTLVISLITFSAATLNIILNYFLIRLNGIIGAGQATLITFFYFFIAFGITLRYYLKIDWFNVKYFVYIIATCKNLIKNRS